MIWALFRVLPVELLLFVAKLMPPTLPTLEPMMTLVFLAFSWARCFPVEFCLWALESEVLILILPAAVVGMPWNACLPAFDAYA